MKNNLFTISDEEYMKKMLNYEVIDGRIYSRSNNIVSKHLNKYRKPTTVRFNHRDHPRIQEELGNGEDWLRFYDHVEDFRIKIPNHTPTKTIRCTFSSPYQDIDTFREHPINPWILDNFKIYLVNPRLYKYFVDGTISFAHVDSLDKKEGEGKTDYWIGLINKSMIEETGEPLFYLI